MINEIKDVFDSLSVRIRSPVFGYAFFTFLAVNWQAFFFLFFADVTVLDKFSYFDENTSIWTLLVLPFIVGVALGLSTPFIRLLMAKANSWPTTKRSLVQVSAQHEVLKEKAKLKREIDNLFALEEEKLIEQAKRDQELDDIENETLKLDVQQKIEDLRSEMRKQLHNQSVIDGGAFEQDQEPRLIISGFRKGIEGHLEIKNIGTQSATNIQLESVETEKGEIPNGLTERFPISKLLPGGTYPIPLYMSFGSAADLKLRLSWERPDASRSEEDFFVGI